MREMDDEEREAHRKMCAMFDACRDAGTPEGIRDAALISVLYGAGATRATVRTLPLRAYDPDRAVLTWRPGGAAGETRARRATDGARLALADWLELRGTAPGPLLCRLAGRSEGPRPLADGAVGSILRRWARRSGIHLPDEADRLRLYASPWWSDVRGGNTQG